MPFLDPHGFTVVEGLMLHRSLDLYVDIIKLSHKRGH